MAGAYYDTLGYHTSYTRLLFRFLFDKNLSVYSRTARSNRGKAKPAAAAVPEEIGG
jgi:sphingolipid delta-4 desaturase